MCSDCPKLHHNFIRILETQGFKFSLTVDGKVRYQCFGKQVLKMTTNERVMDMKRKALGFSAMEMVVTASIVMVAAATGAPSLIKANRAYQLNSAAQQVTQALQTAKFDAIRNNTSQMVIFDTANNTMTVNGRLVTLPRGVTFASLSSETTAPNSVAKGAENKESIGADQCGNKRLAISFPTPSGYVSTLKVATFNSKGLPNVQPGTINWVYLKNVDGEQMAITLTSAGSTRTLQKKESQWVSKSDSGTSSDDDYRSTEDSSNSGSNSGSSSNSGSGSTSGSTSGSSN